MSKNTDTGDTEKVADVALLETDLEAPVPRWLEFALKPMSLAFHVAVLSAVVGGFTGIALWGITLPETIYDKVGSSENADSKTDTYNFRSGLFMAFIEVIVGWWLDKIMPALVVFLHNLLWSSSHTTAVGRVITHIRGFLVFVLPIIVVLTLGNSIRGFQASNSTVGFNSTMLLDDFKKSQSALETLQAAALANETDLRHPSDTILKDAIRQKSSPFSFILDATCSQQNSSLLYAGQRLAPLNVDDLADIAVVYGFDSEEWNTELNLMEIPVDANFSISYADSKGVEDWPEDFNVVDIVNIFLHGTVMLERALANSERLQHNCSQSDGRTDLDGVESSGQWTYASDGTRICQGPATSLFTLFDTLNNMPSYNVESISELIVAGINTSFPTTFELDATTISMESLSLTDQMHAITLTIDLVMNSSISYGPTLDDVACTFYNLCNTTSGNATSSSSSSDASFTDYLWSYYSTSFCGNTSCAFFDWSNTFHLQREVGMIPAVENCSNITYSANYGGWYLDGCDKIPELAVVYGIGSYIGGDTYAYGGRDGVYTFDGEDVEIFYGPYIDNPRRHIQFSFSLVSWGAEDLPELFEAQCDVSDEDGGDCTGMWYQLPQTKRYLFAGEDVLPTDDILLADFHSPIPLVQLNAPSFTIEGTPVVLEYVNADNFGATQWNASLNESLAGEYCSPLVEAYQYMVTDNNYFLELPLEIIYTSTFFYFFEDAAVTELNDTSTSAVAASTSNSLSNVKLKGDQQLRRIKISIPKDSFKISLGGCILVVVLMLVVLAFPIRRAEYFEPGTTTAEKYVALKTNREYPDLVYHKTLVPSKRGDKIPRMNDFDVESLTLLHRSTDGERIEL